MATISGAVEHGLERARVLFEQGELEACVRLCNELLLHAPRHPAVIEIVRHLPGALYDDAFYARQRVNSYKTARAFLGHLFSVFPAHSVVDFGCGVGAWLKAALDLGANSAVGYEGEWVRERAIDPRIEFVFGNLNQIPPMQRRFELSMSVEVAEHIEPRSSEQFVVRLTEAADVVVFAAAMLRQQGDGHINCRYHSFWADLFRQRGYRLIDFFRNRFWYEVAEGIEPWYVQNTFLYVKEDSPLLDKIRSDPLLDVYHPLMLNPLAQQDHAGRKGE